MVNAGFDMSAADEAAPEPEEPSEQEAREATRFFDHELRPTTRYLPDIEALRAARVVVGIGAESGRLVTHRTSTALAELLGSEPVISPVNTSDSWAPRPSSPTHCASVSRRECEPHDA